MHLGLDFDNTLISYDMLFKKVALEQGLVPNGIDENKNAVRNYLRNSKQEDAWTKLQGEVYGGRILQAAPYPGMKQSLRLLADAKIPLSIVSHKTRTPFLGEKWDLHAAARSWLEKNEMHSEVAGPNISREQIYFEVTKKDKCDRIVAAGCSHFIDDLPEILEMLPNTIIKILFSPNDNVTYDTHWLVMRSWSELPKLLGVCK